MLFRSLVDSEPTTPSIFRAICEGRVQWESPHLSLWECVRFFVFDPLRRKPGKIVASFDGHAAK